MEKKIQSVVLDGVQGWFFPDGVNSTPPMSMCEKCGYMMEEERRYRALCTMVNRAGHGINGVTCGTDGYDEKRDSVVRRMRRKDFDFNRRKAHIVKYGTTFKLLHEALCLIRDGVGDKDAIVKAIENTEKRYSTAMDWKGTL